MQLDDSITALASGPGRSHRAIIRLSGSDTPRILSAILDEPADTSGLHRRAIRLPLTHPSQTQAASLVPCLVLTFTAPRTYTGQHSAELQIPGNPALIDRILQLILAQPGVRAASPGEFTARAYLGAKMTLDQAEAVQAIIAAQSESELHAANLLLSGSIGAGFRDLTDQLATTLALVEAGIDFTDQEDVIAITRAKLLHGLRNMTFALTCFINPDADESRTESVRAVLVGPPNAGKSTLFNALLGRERSIINAQAGTTRDAIAESLPQLPGQRAAAPTLLIDLAGLEESTPFASRADAEAQRRAHEEISRAEILILCDPTGRFAELPPAGTSAKQIIRVRTKADQMHGPETPPDDRAIAVCALDGTNLASLRRAIADAAAGAAGLSGAEAMLRPRHLRALRTAYDALQRAIQAVGPDVPAVHVENAELVAAEMRLALDALGEIVGHISPDDVIGRVFSFFCIGK